MATNPTFLSKYVPKISDTGSLVFQPTKNSRIYNAYCRNSSGAGTAKIELGIPQAGGPSVVTANVDVNLSYQVYNTGLTSVEHDGDWYEVFKVLGTINFEDINIELEGTFPLVNETTFQYSLDIPGNPVEQRTKTFAASTTAQAISDAIVLDILSRRELGFFRGRSYTNQILYQPTIQFVKRNSVKRYSPSALKEGSTRPSDLSLFTKSNTGLQFSYSYNTSTVDGKDVPSTELATFEFDRTSSADFGQPSGTQAIPSPRQFNADDLWATGSTHSEFNGEAGSEADPFKLTADLKSKLALLVEDGAVLTGNSQQSFTLTANSFVVSEDIPSIPTLVTSNFTGAGENIELISDDTINPLLLTDVHGNEFFPVNAGQRIVIDAPEAESIILVYGEE